MSPISPSECQAETEEHRESLVGSDRGWIVSLFFTTRTNATCVINVSLCLHGSFKKSWEEALFKKKKKKKLLSKEMLISKLDYA